MDKASWLGILLALGGIGGGLLLEGGKLSQIMQPTAAMIVLGGTAGAVMVQFPMRIILAAMQRSVQVFFQPRQDAKGMLQTLVRFAHQARREGIISLDSNLNTIADSFLRKSLMLAVDGTEPQELRKIMEIEVDNRAEDEEQVPQVFEAAGGFAPTIGIIGAVMGLIQVMQHLDKIDEVGRGIAVAFVATLYGVGAANLIFLPSAGKLRIRIREQQTVREMVLEGIVAILEGTNPRMLESRLDSFLVDRKKERPAEREKEYAR